MKKKLYLIEKYLIDGNGMYHLVQNVRYDNYMKKLYLEDAKRKGYKYDRKKKEYISSEPTESCCSYSIIVSSYYI